jgi:branched-chain amino acid transport system substrate-binding protein
MKRFVLLLALALGAVPLAALAQIKIGVIVSETGPAASLGIVEKNVARLYPETIAAQTVHYVILDDASDTTAAVRNARKLVDEDHVDAIIGSTTTPNSLAITEVAAASATPMLAMGAGASIVSPQDAKKRWVFKPVQDDAMMVSAIVEHMIKSGSKTVGFLGFSDATGEGYWNTLKPLAEKAGIRIVANERYNRTDASVTGQVLRIVAANPDAVLIAAFGSPAALPQLAFAERGYKGRLYQTHGVANNDFLRVAGKSAEGTFLPVGPLLIADQLPQADPVGRLGSDIAHRYETAYGAGSKSTFISAAYDPFLLIAHAVPEALKKAKPGTKEFRAALRDALEATDEFVGTQGVYNMSPTDHVGLDKRARYMVKVENGTWKLVQ